MDLFWIIVIATSIWVLIDAKTIGVKKGQIQGMGNLGPWGWFFACLLLWIIGFPFYLAKRSEFKRINSGSSQGDQIIATGSPQTKKGLSVVHWIGIIVFGGIALLALFGQRNDGTTGIGRIASGGASSNSTSAPEGSTTATAIAQAYEENTVAADQKFKGKRFKITGTVADINTDFMGDPYVTLKGGVNQFMEPQFGFDKSSSTQLANLYKGATITLVCTGKGDIAKTPMWDSCTLQ
ncbi:OB-fold protein [Parasulfuritortus cantonensis]|jgi:hypothetical protein|nr:hypothetical protein [Parasulfuritortus cantonensis]